MPTPQPGIFAQGARAHHYLEFNLHPDAEPAELRAAVGAFHEPSLTAGGLNLVVAFGAAALERLGVTDVPADLATAHPIVGDPGVPATQHDLWVWCHGTGPDVVLDGARAVTALLDRNGTLALEQQAFVYRDSRDLTGFVDGTENPPVWEAPDVAVVADDALGAGGSHVLAMKWVHDLAAFDRLPVAEQERVIGRTKADSVELDDVPADAHIGRVVIEEDGEELEIYRRSTPFGDVHELGLYFVAFSADPTRFDKMLGRMFGADDGIYDRITGFSRAVSNARYFAPPTEVLMSFAD